MRYRTAIVLFVVSICFDACSRQTVPTTTTIPTTLPSGKQVKISNIVPMHFAAGAGALIMSCETDTPLTDKTTLRKEVDEVWTTVFRDELERANVTHGIIRMSHREGLLIKHEEDYSFAFEKRPDGQWRCLEDDKR